ncbi:hypothetical protein DWX99_15500, partial [Firmicutes bacterium AF22-6AC]
IYDFCIIYFLTSHRWTYLSLFYYNNCEFSSMQQVFISSGKNRFHDTLPEIKIFVAAYVKIC